MLLHTVPTILDERVCVDFTPETAPHFVLSVLLDAVSPINSDFLDAEAGRR